MKTFRCSSGFALVSAIVMTGVAAILIAGVIGYVSWTVRTAAIYTGRDICRLAAQSEIEAAKTVVNTAFIRSIHRLHQPISRPCEHANPLHGAVSKRCGGFRTVCGSA